MALRVIGLGAGGHAKVIIEILSLDKAYEVIGLLDIKKELKGDHVLGIPVLGNDDLLPELKQDGVDHFFMGLGGVGDNKPRRRLFERAEKSGMHPVSAIHPQAIISSSAVLGAGIAVMAGAVVNADVRLGVNVIVNTGSIVDHDCTVSDHVHIATGARLASTVQVGQGAHIGIGAIVRQGIIIGEGAIVGAGAVVVKDVVPHSVVIGVPAHSAENKTA